MIKTIKIEGMHCPNCVAAVKRELEALEGVSKVDVSLEEAQAIVEVEDVADETLQEAIEDIGFDVVEIKLTVLMQTGYSTKVEYPVFLY